MFPLFIEFIILLFLLELRLPAGYFPLVSDPMRTSVALRNYRCHHHPPGAGHAHTNKLLGRSRLPSLLAAGARRSVQARLQRKRTHFHSQKKKDSILVLF